MNFILVIFRRYIHNYFLLTIHERQLHNLLSIVIMQLSIEQNMKNINESSTRLLIELFRQDYAQRFEYLITVAKE